MILFPSISKIFVSAPATIAAIMRGKRIFQIILLYAGELFLRSAAKQSATDIFEEPTKRHKKDIKISVINRRNITVSFFVWDIV